MVWPSHKSTIEVTAAVWAWIFMRIVQVLVFQTTRLLQPWSLPEARSGP